MTQRTKTPYDQDEYLIKRPRVVPALALIRDIILTLLVWALFFFLLEDSFHVIIDFGHWVASGFQNTSSYASFPDTFTLLIRIMVIALICSVFLGWSSYNSYRFAGKTRRRTVRSLDSEELARYYHVPLQMVKHWQGSKRLIVHLDQEGNLMHVSDR